MRKAHPKKFFSKEEEQNLVSAIQKAELLTSGEIRVHLARKCKNSVYGEATKIFEKLGMTKTAERNGVLFFLSLQEKKFAVIGDIGIHQKISPHFWDKIRDILQENFKKGDFIKGLTEGIHTCGVQLAQHFPRKLDDKNELSDDISRS